MSSAAQILDELLHELGGGPELLERLIAESPGADRSNPAWLHDRADEAIDELRRAWGPTSDPHWIEGMLPHHDGEFNFLLALFRKDRRWGYVRISASELSLDEGGRQRLFFGVAG